MQAVADLGQRQDAHPRRRQLDRQRHAVEAPADLRRGGGVVVGEAEIGADLSRAVGEQLDRLVGQRQRRHPPTHLAGHPDRLTTRRHKRHRRAAALQADNQRRARVQQMLTVVQHQQHPTVADKPQQRVHRGAARLIGQAQRADHRDRHQIGIGDRRQIDQPHPAAESTGDLGGDLHRQARFADTARAGERHEPVVGQDLPHVVHFGFAAHETRELHRKMLGDNGFGVRSGGKSLRRSGWHSCTTRSRRGRSRS